MADTKQPELSLERFGALVEAYGGDLERFPERERVPAKALVLRSREARRLLEAASTFDELLASAREHVTRVDFETLLMRIPEQHAQQRTLISLLPFRSLGRASLAAAAAVALGLISGQLGSDTTEVASAGLSIEQAELSALTFGDELLDELTDAEGSAE
jgi:hypothetical protein